MKILTSLLTLAALAFLPLAGYAQDATLPTATVLSYAGAPASGTSEIDTLTIQSGTSAGTFTITVAGGRTTTPITWSATDATLVASVDAALEALSVIGTGGVTTAAGTLSSGIGTITITFTGKNAKMDFPLLSIGTNSLTGGTAPTLTTTTAGVAATYQAAPTGQLITDVTNGKLYQNTSGTANSPTWTVIESALGIDTSAELRTLLTDETGTGVAVFATTPTLVTPVLGAATGTSLNLGATGVLSTTAQSGTGSIAMTTSPTFTTPVLGAATGTSATVTGAIRTSSATLPIGYNTGAGFAVTQLTNKQTTVVSDTPAGVITMNNESLVNDTETTFQVTCASCAAVDVPQVAIASVGTAGKYLVTVSAVAAGSFKITVSNVGTTAGEAIVLNYVILKGSGS